MHNQVLRLKGLINDAQKILITSHISPDPDALSSVILMATTLAINFPDKQIQAALEEEPAKLSFLPNYNQVKFQSIFATLQEFKPDLFILLDCNNYERITRHDAVKTGEYIQNNSIKTAIIDHHEPVNKQETDVYINQNSPACAADVYDVCFHQLQLKKPAGAAENAMIGLYADSGGFVYLKDGAHTKIFNLAQELVDAGVNIEKIKNQLNQFDVDDVLILRTLFDNATSQDDYSYSFLTDQFIEDWVSRGKTNADLQPGTNLFLNEFIRNINNRQWGFIVFRNKLQGDNIYTVSFRSVGGVKDVSEMAIKLGGGGHKPAAGSRFEAKTLDEAINKLRSVIANT